MEGDLKQYLKVADIDYVRTRVVLMVNPKCQQKVWVRRRGCHWSCGTRPPDLSVAGQAVLVLVTRVLKGASPLSPVLFRLVVTAVPGGTRLSPQFQGEVRP